MSGGGFINEKKKLKNLLTLQIDGNNMNTQGLIPLVDRNAYRAIDYQMSDEIK